MFLWEGKLRQYYKSLHLGGGLVGGETGAKIKHLDVNDTSEKQERGTEVREIKAKLRNV